METIALILQALASAVGLTNVFGKDAAKLAPVLRTLGHLASLPAETKADQDALLAQVQTWVRENRGPTDEEIDAFTAARDALDEKLRAARANLENPPQGGL
jgi:hypothetical protein